jgi:hypothetical protein
MDLLTTLKKRVITLKKQDLSNWYTISHENLLSHDRVTTDGVRIGNQIYWALSHTTHDYTLQITIIQRVVFSAFSVMVFTALLGGMLQRRSALGFHVQWFLSSLAGTFQLLSWTTTNCQNNSRCTTDSLCTLGTDRIENISPNRFSVVASCSYRHRPHRECRFPVTPVLHVMKLLPNKRAYLQSRSLATALSAGFTVLALSKYATL